jgi:hypothetical protein
MKGKRFIVIQRNSAMPFPYLAATTSPKIIRKIQTMPFDVSQKGRRWPLALKATDVREIKQTSLTSLLGDNGVGY